MKLEAYSKVVNAKLLKERLWKYIESRKPLPEEQKENEDLLYKTEFSSMFSDIQGNQPCSPQACFVCLLHLANEKGINYFFYNNLALSIKQPGDDIGDFNVLKLKATN